MKSSFFIFVTFACALTCISCGNSPPLFYPISSQTAYVGTRFEIELQAQDLDGDRLTFDYNIVDLTYTADRAGIDNLWYSAIFHWKPVSSDVGQHLVDFSVTDGLDADLESIVITVEASAPGNAPRFLKPLANGMTLKLAETNCATVDVLVDDPDSLMIDLKQLTEITGSEFSATSPKSARFYWCLSQAQKQQKTYTLVFTANDYTNPIVEKRFTINLE